MQKFHAVLCLSMVAAVAVMTGCGAGSPSLSTATVLGGSVYGGSQAISGASVQLWAAGTTATSASPTPTVQSAVVTTGPDGSFSLANVYSCPVADPAANVYLISRGGDAGVGPNSAIALMAMLGPCNGLTSSTHIRINEETTVVAVDDLSWWMDFSGNVGLTTNSTVTQNQSELLVLMQTGFSALSEDINVATGVSPGPDLPPGQNIDVPLINTFADLLAVCVDSAPGGGMCAKLFGYATVTASGQMLIDGQPIPTGYTPTDTLQFALINASVPSTSLTPTSFASEYLLIPPQPPFQPTVSAPPTTTWGNTGTQILAVTATGDGIVHIPFSQENPGAFAVALAISTPVTPTISVSTSTGATVPVLVTLCQTNPGTGACVESPGTSVGVSATANSNVTFSVFVQATAPITNSPPLSVIVTDANGNLLATTGVTLTTN
jgi:hypothetical protein